MLYTNQCFSSRSSAKQCKTYVFSLVPMPNNVKLLWLGLLWLGLLWLGLLWLGFLSLGSCASVPIPNSIKPMFCLWFLCLLHENQCVFALSYVFIVTPVLFLIRSYVVFSHTKTSASSLVPMCFSVNQCFFVGSYALHSKTNVFPFVPVFCFNKASVIFHGSHDFQNQGRVFCSLIHICVHINRFKTNVFPLIPMQNTLKPMLFSPRHTPTIVFLDC